MITPADSVYISGPMTGRPAFNIPLFLRVENRLRWRYGCRVLNPARQPAGLTWQEYMQRDIDLLRGASVILQLPGWQQSRGAKIELDFAMMQGARVVCARAAEVIR